MEVNEFVINVRKLSIPDDFDKYYDILNDIHKGNYDNFLNLLKLGYNIKTAKKGLYYIVDLSKNTYLTTQDIIELIPKFNFINAISEDK